MGQIDLAVPEPVRSSLPEADDDAAADMQRAVEGLEAHLNRAIENRGEDEAAAVVVDAIERLEERYERYDAFVPELRAWGQSPIYAIAWRNLQADLIAQLEGHDWLAGHLDRERNARIVEDGIRFGDR